jgi:hypothetical protein
MGFDFINYSLGPPFGNLDRTCCLLKEHLEKIKSVKKINLILLISGQEMGSSFQLLF